VKWIRSSDAESMIYIKWRDQDLNKGSIPKQNDRRYGRYDKQDTREFVIVMAFAIH
jgi:hypothetical protein